MKPGGSYVEFGLVGARRRLWGLRIRFHRLWYRLTRWCQRHHILLRRMARPSLHLRTLHHQPTQIHHRALNPQSSTSHQLPTTNIFGELSLSRGSSWQYELQQLKFKNMRFVQEIEALEASVSSVSVSGSSVSSSSVALSMPVGFVPQQNGRQNGNQ
jgi:hypothetical protein